MNAYLDITTFSAGNAGHDRPVTPVEAAEEIRRLLDEVWTSAEAEAFRAQVGLVTERELQRRVDLEHDMAYDDGYDEGYKAGMADA